MNAEAATPTPPPLSLTGTRANDSSMSPLVTQARDPAEASERDSPQEWGGGHLLLSFHHSGYQCQRVREGRGSLEDWSRLSLPLGKPYSENWTAKWSYLYPLATNVPNTGFFTFTPKPASPQYQRWKVGALRISSSHNYPGKQ